MAGHKHPSYLKIYFTLLILFIISVLGPELAEILGLEGVSRVVLVLSTLWYRYMESLPRLCVLHALEGREDLRSLYSTGMSFVAVRFLFRNGN